MFSLKKNDTSVFSLQLVTEAAVVFPGTGVAWSKLLCHTFWRLFFLQSQKASLAWTAQGGVTGPPCVLSGSAAPRVGVTVCW